MAFPTFKHYPVVAIESPQMKHGDSCHFLSEGDECHGPDDMRDDMERLVTTHVCDNV
jgi:hypothetical protein